MVTEPENTMSSRRLALLPLLTACAHTPATEAPSRVPATQQPAVVAPAVLPSPTVISARLGCGAHGGDGDHVPLSRHLGLTVQLELSDPGDISIQTASWTLELAGRTVRADMHPLPAELLPGEPLSLSGDRYISQDQGEDLEQGVDSREEREPIDVLLEIGWTREEVTTTTSHSLALRPTGCFEPPE